MADNNNVEVSDADIENMLNVLENFGSSNEGRLKIQTSDEVEAGTTDTKYHYGRCDVGSPFAKGTPFDASDNGGCG
ncbi:MAG: hypothetical protein K5656_08500 [Lachnospiraceae bacterium]|nr:hypothetical protein [Lachnospiraceae bacterium]